MIKIIFILPHLCDSCTMNQISSDSYLRKTSGQTNCCHCGDICDTDVIVLEGKPFCCEGCKLVYTILNENGLDNFYNLEKLPGVSQKNRTSENYAYLDDPDTIAKLIDFTDGAQTRIHFLLPDIHCVACIWLLENLYQLHKGVIRSRVDFLKKEASITFSNQDITLRQLVELLSKIGYPPRVNLNDLDKEKMPAVNRSFYYKIGVAGFAFGNIMLLSFPEYLGVNVSESQDFILFFGYLNILLSLPVVFYSGWDYLRSAWLGLKQKQLNIDVPVSLGILAIFLRSLYEILSHSGAGYLDSLAGLIFFLLIGKWFQKNTYSRISFDRDYKSYFPISSMLKKENREIPVTLDKIKIGDTLCIRHGELIPADSVLVSGEAKIDYSFVTGESDYVKKLKGDQLYAGGRQMGGLIELAVVKKVSNSYLTQLWNEDTFEKERSIHTVSRLANKVAGVFTVLILLVASATLIYWLPIDTAKAVNAFTAVLIIACPCAVALSIPFTFGNLVRVLAKQNIYFKNINVIESLAKVDHIVFDKTGTITSSKDSEMDYKGEPLSEREKHMVYTLTSHSAHPLSQKLKSTFDFEKPLTLSKYQEIKGQGISAKVDGHDLRIGSAAFILKKTNKDSVKQNLFIEIDGQYKGAYTYQAQYRKGLAKVISMLKKWAKVSLLSGDNDREKDKLSPLFTNQFFNRKPAEKLAHIKQLQNQGDRVAMIGDGLNDAGALSQSEVGIVVTEQASNFTPACDLILDARQFELLPQLIRWSEQSIQIVYVTYVIALLYNVIGLSYAVQGLLSPVIAAILMPLSSVTVVLIGVGLSGWIVYRNK